MEMEFWKFLFIILGAGFFLIIYFGIKGTNEVIDYHNRKYREDRDEQL